METKAREKLRQFRISEGLTQSAMAAKLRLSTVHYKAVEYGYADPSVRVLMRFHEIYKDKCGDILGLFIA